MSKVTDVYGSVTPIKIYKSAIKSRLKLSNILFNISFKKRH